MKIRLILAAHDKDVLKNDPFMPLSLPIIASSAPEHEYFFTDMLQCEKINFNEKVDLVGISYRITADKTAKKIAERFRARKIPVIFGGPQASNTPFEAKKYADAVVIGEVESLWTIILEDLKKGLLKDFYVCSPKKFEGHGYKVHQIFSYFDLKKAAVPIRKYYKKKYIFDTVYATRGCPIDCDFCSVSNLYGSEIRLRNIDDVVKEIDSFKNYYYMLDDNVFGRSSNYDYYTELYTKISKLKRQKLWIGQANLDAAANKKGREVIKLAAKSGLIQAALGIETINYDTMKNNNTIYKLGIKEDEHVINKMKENIFFIQNQGIIISGWFTVGYDEDTIQTFYDILDFCFETNILPIISWIEALPATRLYDRLVKEKRIDENKKINIVHPVLKDDEIIASLKDIIKKGYSIKADINRLKFYFNLFNNDTKDLNKKIFHKIYKTIFLFVTQTKLKKGIATFVNTENH